ncbi:hypothetical protein [Pontibacillus litoralis]|nr:hypothetical protein [Pontibacillus litoralis]
MRKIKSIIVTALVAVVILSAGSIAVQGLGHQHISKGSGTKVYIQGYNTIGHKGTGLYGTNKEKVVTGVKVRLKEGKFNKAANNYKKKGGWTKKLSKFNNPFQKAKTSYSWRY